MLIDPKSPISIECVHDHLEIVLDAGLEGLEIVLDAGLEGLEIVLDAALEGLEIVLDAALEGLEPGLDGPNIVCHVGYRLVDVAVWGAGHKERYFLAGCQPILQFAITIKTLQMLEAIVKDAFFAI